MEFKSGKRAYARIDFPASVIIDGNRIEVIDWSLGGFSIADGCVSEESFSEGEVKFSFTLAQGQLVLDLISRKVRVSDSGFVVSFMFVDMPAAVIDTLQSIVGGYLSGETINLNESIENGVKGKLFEFEKARLISHWFKFASISVAILLVFTFTSVLVYKKIFDIDPEYAAVVENDTQMQATRSGILEYTSVHVGDAYEKGQPIYRIVSEEQKKELEDKRSELSSLKTEIYHLENRVKDTDYLLSSYKEHLKSDSTSLKNRIDILKSEIKVQKNQYNLLTEGDVSDVVDKATKNDTLLVLYEKKRALFKFKEMLAQNLNSQAVVEKGFFPQNNISTVSNINELKDTLAFKRLHKKLLENEISEMEDSLIYRSPCHCKVVEVDATQGPIVANKVVLMLSQVESEKWILALAPLDEADRIYKGATATYRLASSEKLYKGTVSEVSYYSSSEPEVFGPNGESVVGLPKTLPRMQQYTLVKIKPESPLTQSKSSEPVSVNIELGFFHSLKRSLEFL